MTGSKFETSGYFFLPKLKKQKQYGTLSIDGNNIRLKLINELPDLVLVKDKVRNILPRNNEPEYSTVFGLTADGCIRLKKQHFGRSVRWGFSGFHPTEESFSIALVSEENINQGKKEPKFKRVKFKIIRSKDFINISNISGGITTKEDNFTEFSMKAELSKALLFEFTSNIYKIRFEAEYNFSLQTDNPEKNHMPIEERPVITIEKTRGYLSVEEILELVFSFRNLIAFALRDSVYPTEINAFNEAVPKEPNTKKEILKTKMFIHDKNYKEITKSNRFYHLFNLQDLQDNMGKYFGAWQKSRKKYRVLHDNFFGNLYNNNLYWENRVLSLISGIESYVDLELKTKIVTQKIKTQEKEIAEAEVILKTLPENEFSKYINGRVVDYRKNASLKQKFIALVELLPEKFKSTIDNKDIDIILDLRNAIAHGGDAQKHVEIGIDKDILEKLEKLAEFCLLRSMMLPNEKIEQFLIKPY